MKKWLPLSLIIAFGVLCYSNIFNNEFLFDDPDIILNNKAIRDIFNLKSVLLTNYWHSIANAGLYRPLVFFTYALDYHFWGKEPAGYHISNLIFHLITCWILYSVFARFLKSRRIAFAGALLFAAHPVHTEAVTGIVGRAEVLMALFFLLGWLLFLKSESTIIDSPSGKINIFKRNLMLSAGCYFLALCSKENAVVLPVILISLLLRWDHNKSFYQRIENILRVGFLYFVPLCIYLAVRWSVIGSFSPQGTEQFFHNVSSSSVFFTMMRVFLMYGKLLLVPTNLLCSYRLTALSSSLFEWRVLFSLVGVIIWFCAALRYFKSGCKGQFGLFFILVSLLPVSNIIRIGDIMAERFLYLPSVGFVLFAAEMWCKTVCGRSLEKNNKFYLMNALLLLCALAFCLGTIKRNAEWRTGIIFWKTTLRDIPDSNSGYFNLAVCYREKGAPEMAIKVLKRSLEIHPNHIPTRIFLAEMYYSAGQYENAIRENTVVLDRGEHQSVVYKNLALNYIKLQDYEKAREYCMRGIEQASDAQNALYHTLVRIYLNTGDMNNALFFALKAVEYDQSDVMGYILSGDIYKRFENYEKAEYYLKKALALDENSHQALDYLAAVYYRKHDFDQAIKVWNQAIKLYPDDEHIWYYIGLTYELKGNLPAAKDAWRNITRNHAYVERVKERLHRLTENNGR
ncbi:MAG: tetratricopeptide repeat protein [bacterium]|nr:tetratricopeptide repeat protein [bacterium]